MDRTHLSGGVLVDSALSPMVGYAVHAENLHQSHPDLVKRLKRADGHLQNVIKMMVDGRECSEIAQQLHAVEKAITAAKKLLIHDHLDHCLADAARSPRDIGTAIADFKDITKYL